MTNDVNVKLKEANKQIEVGLNLFSTQWSKLIQFLIEGEIVRLFKEKQIEIEYTSTKIKGKGLDFDIIAHSGTKIIVVEVKTNLKVSDVEKFKSKLGKINTMMQTYRHQEVYGAVAYLKADEQSDTYSESKGLWVIRATGDSASIIDREHFKPKIY